MGEEFPTDAGEVLGSEGKSLGPIETSTREHSAMVRVGGSVLNKSLALGGVLPLKSVVHGDSEGTADPCEVLGDVRDSSKSITVRCVG